MWRAEPEDVKQLYHNMADEEKRTHRQMFPDYRCAPRKSSEIKRRKTRNAAMGNVQDAADMHINNANDAANPVDNAGEQVGAPANDAAVARPEQQLEGMAAFYRLNNLNFYRARVKYLEGTAHEAHAVEQAIRARARVMRQEMDDDVAVARNCLM
jgi:hypothetical protein